MDSQLVMLLVFARVGTMLFTAPLLGSRAVPLRLRLGLTVVLTGCTFLLIDVPTRANRDSLVTLFFAETTIGLMLGMGILIVFSAAQMVGTIISQMAGIQLPASFDPQQGQPTNAVGQLFNMLSLAAFALAGGPELLISATLDSYQALPIGIRLDTSAIGDLLPALLQQSFILTLRGVGPAVAAMLISTIVMGWISRTYPQMNLFNLGLSSNLIVMFLAIAFTLGGSVWLFVDDLHDYMSTIAEFLQAGVQS